MTSQELAELHRLVREADAFAKCPFEEARHHGRSRPSHTTCLRKRGGLAQRPRRTPLRRSAGGGLILASAAPIETQHPAEQRKAIR
jgi:hypothetical protein